MVMIQTIVIVAILFIVKGEYMENNAIMAQIVTKWGAVVLLGLVLVMESVVNINFVIMKKLYCFIACTVILVIAVSSCKQKKDSSAEEIRTELISKDFIALDEYVKNLSPEEKADLWKLKIQDTLESENLTEEEKAAIRDYSDILTKACYEGDTAQSHELCEKSENLEQTLIEKFGWDEKKLFHYLGIVLTDAEIAVYNEKYGTDF